MQHLCPWGRALAQQDHGWHQLDRGTDHWLASQTPNANWCTAYAPIWATEQRGERIDKRESDRERRERGRGGRREGRECRAGEGRERGEGKESREERRVWGSFWISWFTHWGPKRPAKTQTSHGSSQSETNLWGTQWYIRFGPGLCPTFLRGCWAGMPNTSVNKCGA